MEDKLIYLEFMVELNKISDLINVSKFNYEQIMIG